MSHEIVDEQIFLMAKRSLLTVISKNNPAWYAIIGDEATDVAKKEQLNLSIRWLNKNYEISEDPVGLYYLPNTSADTVYTVIKDVLIRCCLPLSLSGGKHMTVPQTCKGYGVVLPQEYLEKIQLHCLYIVWLIPLICAYRMQVRIYN